MTLTLGDGPLASQPPATVNYQVEGPAHRLFWHQFPRRVRAVFGDEVVLDSTNAKLLHESDLLPQLYVPRADLRADLLEASALRTQCPYKGEAAYRSVRVGQRVADNAVWAYPEPLDEAAWLAGHVAVNWDAMDAWFDEDEEVFGEIRDPFHRVDARRTSRHVRVVVADTVVAESRRALLLSETGLPNRFYLPPDDVHPQYLAPSGTHTVCPYKGTASYANLKVNGAVISDAAWFYPTPLADAPDITNFLCFLGTGVRTLVDGLEAP